MVDTIMARLLCIGIQNRRYSHVSVENHQKDDHASGDQQKTAKQYGKRFSVKRELVIAAFEDPRLFQREGYGFIEHQHQTCIHQCLGQIEGQEQGRDDLDHRLYGAACHVVRCDDQVEYHHQCRHAENGSAETDHRACHGAFVLVNSGADRGKRRAGSEIHNKAVGTRSADGHKFQQGNDQRHDNAPPGTKDHRGDCHDGVFGIKGQKGNVDTENKLASIGQCAKNGDNDHAEQLFSALCGGVHNIIPFLNIGS